MSNSKNIQIYPADAERAKEYLTKSDPQISKFLLPDGSIWSGLPVEIIDSNGNTIKESETSTLNSTTTPLKANETFTGEGEDITNFNGLRVALKTNVESAEDGLSIQFSMDNVNWDWSDDYTIKGGYKEEISCPRTASYFRIVYTNGTEDQTYFRLSVLKERNQGKKSSHRIKDTLSEEDDAELTKSVICFVDKNEGEINSVGVQNPLPVDDDQSIVASNIWVAESDMGDFSGLPTDLFDNIHTTITNTTSNNPKIILIHFHRTIVCGIIALGTQSGNFSNVKFEALNSGGTYIPLLDDSTNNTKYVSHKYDLPILIGFNGVRISFYTSDTVSLSNLSMRKVNDVHARIVGIKPDGTGIDISASVSGALRQTIEDGETGVRNEVEPLGGLRTITPFRSVGITFGGSTKDTNFWTETVTGSGAITQSGQLTLSTGTTANSTVKYQTIKKARKVVGVTNQFRCTAGLTTDAQLNNIRRIGPYDANDGFFLQSNGITMQVVSRKGGVDTAISSGSFNGNYGLIWTPVVNTLYRLVIDYTAGSAKFFVNGTLLHTIQNTVAGYTNTLNFPVTMENINSGGNTTNNIFIVQFACILRLGALLTEPNWKYIGTNTTTVLKYSSATLNSIVNCDNAGTVTIYDNTSATGDSILIDTAKVLGPIELGLPMSNGITIVTAGNAKIIVKYE